MNFMPFLAQNNAGTGNFLLLMLGYVVIFIPIIYFLMIRPQKKQQKQQAAMLSTIESGDSILTTSGFYGVVIDVMEDILIVEFGSNKNCRIPMKKTAVVEVEKQNQE